MADQVLDGTPGERVLLDGGEAALLGRLRQPVVS